MDVKTLSTIIGHVSSATMLNTYTHITEEIRGSRSAVDEEIGAGDKGSFSAHQQFRHIGYLIRRTRTSGRAFGKHILVEVSAGAVELVNS